MSTPINNVAGQGQGIGAGQAQGIGPGQGQGIGPLNLPPQLVISMIDNRLSQIQGQATNGGAPPFHEPSKYAFMLALILDLQLQAGLSYTIPRSVYNCLEPKDADWLGFHFLQQTGIFPQISEIMAKYYGRDPKPAIFIAPPGYTAVATHILKKSFYDMMYRAIGVQKQRHALMKHITATQYQHVRRPPNSWILYRKAHHAETVEMYPDLKNCEISTVIAKMWNNESNAVRKHYKKLADKAKELHQRQYPGYVYTPRSSASIARRNGRQ